MAAVHRDPQLLSAPAAVVNMWLATLQFVYTDGLRQLYIVSRNLSCKATFRDWRPTMGKHVALLHPVPNLIWRMSLFGGWLASGVVPRARRDFAPDFAYVEVLRIALDKGALHASDGGEAGCWFELSRGSGISLHVGRSLRVDNRSELARELGINLTLVFAKPLRGGIHHWMAWRRAAESASNFSHAPWPPALFAGLALDDEVGLRRRYFDNNPWRFVATGGGDREPVCKPFHVALHC